MTSDSETSTKSPRDAAFAPGVLARSTARNVGLQLSVAGGLAAFGLWMSFHYSRAAWGPDPDTFVTIALWRGFQEHGLSFFSSWSYTQDNWLFSLIPISSAVFAVVGATPEAAMALGWGGFVLSVAFALGITAAIAGRVVAILLGCVLLCASYSALGQAGFLSYPISHNVSMVWGLAAIALALRGLTRGSLAACLAATLAIFLNTVSDPWSGAAVALPMIAGAAAIAATRAEGRRQACVLALGVLFAFVCARTRLFGALGFLPASHFALTDLRGMLANIHWGGIALARMFNIVPGATPAQPGVLAFDLLALAGILGAAALSAALNWRRMRLSAQFVMAVSICSIVAIAVLFLAGRWDAGPSVGRFFPNLYFLGAIMVASQAALHWREGAFWPRAGVALYGALLVVSAASERPELWLDPPPAPEATATRSLGDYLAAHSLAYGYGPFWGAQALMMDTVTDGSVTVRPVSFRDGRVRRRPAETSRFWFEPRAEPSNARVFLIIRNDGEECLDTRACEEMAAEQFGKPVERLQFEDAAILVWDQPLAPRIDR